MPTSTRTTTLPSATWLLGCVLAGGAGAAELPLPCLGTCGAGPGGVPIGFVTQGSATAAASGNTLTVIQSSDRATLNWAQFNLSSDGRVVFQQPGAASVALNRIFQDSPSRIFGQISANGQIYLINPNGLLFGTTSQVNVGGLLASTLSLSEQAQAAGLLAPLQVGSNPALLSDGRKSVVDLKGNAVLGLDGKPLQVTLVVQAGATLKAPGGRILLAAQRIENGGDLQAPDGQVILAAGEKVYLQASNSAALRGLLVEVEAGGKAWNQLTGQISAARGNVTLVGLAVNQEGRISATTTVAANGSVRLLARDTQKTAFTTDNVGVVSLAANHGGELTLGPQSSITVNPETNDTHTAVDAQKQVPSSVELVGQQVFIHGAHITAHGGTLEVSALADPHGVPVNGNAASKLRIDAGARIDLSGSNATLPMSSHRLAVELRANELANSPNQRNGALRGKTVYIDRRVGTPLANVQGAIEAIAKSVAERTAAGGSAKFLAEGDLVVAADTSIDVSGGAIQYTAGSVATSQLLGANGRLYDIGSADPALNYLGVLNASVNQTYDRWGVISATPTPGAARFEPGYVEGAVAGRLQFAAPHLVLNGVLAGNAVSGPYQRNGVLLNGVSVNPGGTLAIGLPTLGPAGGQFIDYLAPAVRFVTQATPVVLTDAAALGGALTLDLPTDYVTRGGFTHTEIYSNQQVMLPPGLPLELSPGGSLRIDAPRVDLLSNITALGGRIEINSVTTNASAGSQGPVRGGIGVGAAVVLNVRGTFTRDSGADSAFAPLSPTWWDGGSIALTLRTPGSELLLGDGATLGVSGGAWLQANGKVKAGAGGSIALRSGVLNSALEVGRGVALDGFGAVGARGGGFSLEATRLVLAQGGRGWAGPQRIDELTSPGAAFLIGAPLFSDYGFAAFDLSASGPAAGSAGESNLHVFDVLAGTHLVARANSLQLPPDAGRRASGGSLFDISRSVTLPENQRTPVSVALRVAPRAFDTAAGIDGGSALGQLTFAAGASLTADAGSSFRLSSTGGILFDGLLRAPAGTVVLEIPTPPDLNVDPGYRPLQRIELGANSLIDVRGTRLLAPNDNGLLLGQVWAGGSVSLLANRGSIVAQPRAQIDVSGVAALLDLANAPATGGYVRHLVGSAGGALTVLAREAISWLAELRAAAGLGDGVRSPGGSMAMSLTRSTGNIGNAVQGTFPTQPRVLRLTTDPAGNAVAPANSGLAIVSTRSIIDSGVDSLSLLADDRIEMSAQTQLALARELRLDAPVLAVTGSGPVTLSAPYVSFGNSQRLVSAVSGVAAGTGSLAISGELIDLVGASLWQGINVASVSSSGDLRLRGVDRGQAIDGSVRLAGDLRLAAARIFPTTLSRFAIDAEGPVSQVLLRQSGASPGVPLSVGGVLSIGANRIEQGGTLMAPFGSLILNAAERLTLAPGSITSVSGDRSTMLYGRVQNGSQWLFDLVGGPSTVSGVPARSVQLTAPNVDIASSARIDLRGGGDLYAPEFIPGTGGSRDALANTAPAGGTVGLYAVLPSLRGQFAPFDPQQFAGSTLRPGDGVYLSGVAGLPAGVYPLLPARYALLPGAFLVSLAAGFGDLIPGRPAALADGTAVSAGYFTFGNTGLGDARYSGFAVRPGDFARTLATYQDNFASSYFATVATATGAAPPVLPADAAGLSLRVGTSLNALGQVLSVAAPGGHAADIALSATNLEITGAVPAAVAADTVQVAASVLQSWQAGRLLIGGRRAPDGQGVEVLAGRVTVDGGAALSAEEVMLVAGQAIDLRAGASLATPSAAAGKAPATLPAKIWVPLSGAAGAGAALLAVSDRAVPIAQRPAGGSGAAADILMDPAAALRTHGALAVDGLGRSLLAGSIDAGGASWSLAASRLAFVAASGGGAGGSGVGLDITPTLLAALQTAGAIRLASTGSIEFSTALALGASAGATQPSLNDLTMVASSISNLSPDNQVYLGARTLTLQGLEAGSNAVPVAAAGTGGLSLLASRLNLGPGRLRLGGFSQVDAHVAGPVVAQGTGSLALGGDLSIMTSVLTTADGADYTLDVPAGMLRLGVAPPGPLAPMPAGLGGKLTLTADRIQQQGALLAPGGSIALNAARYLSMGSTASVDVAGVLVMAGGRAVGADGGRIALVSGGDLDVAIGSRLSVAAAGGANAGRIAVQAAGKTVFGADLAGAANAGARGGSFALDAGAWADTLGNLSARLARGGFTEAQQIRVRSGDLVLGSADRMLARQVALVADNGLIDLGGQIIASATGLQGSIRAYGGAGVRLAAGGVLRADAGGPSGRGGGIELGTTQGRLALQPGSVVSATGLARRGELWLRAPALGPGAGNEVAIDALGADLSGVGQVVVVSMLAPFLVSTAPTAADFTAINVAAGNYIGAAGAAIRARLATATTPVVVRPGVELRQTGDLTLGALDLRSWRFDGQPAVLGVRAGGTLSVVGSVGDGIDASAGVRSRLILRNEPSTSINLIAGADFSSADPLAVRRGAPADLIVADHTAVRTGTGELNLAAARDVSLGSGTTLLTAGLPGAPQQFFGGRLVFDFPTSGGNLGITAGRDLLGSPVTQSVSEWQTRQAKAGLPAQWAVNVGQFGWNAGVLGGGDLVLSAGRDVVNFSAAVADSQGLGGAGTHFGGGGLMLEAGGDVASGQFFVARGVGELNAGGAFSTLRTDATGAPLGSLLLLGDAQLRVTSRGDLALAGVLNPTVLYVPNAPGAFARPFLTLSERSQLQVRSAAGNVLFGGGDRTLSAFLGEPVVLASDGNALRIFPASLTAQALRGDLIFSGSAVVLHPSATGQLDLFAGRDLNGGNTDLLMSDAVAGTFPSAASPTGSFGALFTAASGVRHLQDAQPVLITAGRDLVNFIGDLPKAATLSAGRDIINLKLNVQNVALADSTRLSAGRDFLADSSATTAGVAVGGPGQLWVLAGRHVDLGFSQGLTTVGALVNANLPVVSGADLAVFAGLGNTPNYSGFITRIIAPSAAYRGQLQDFVAALTGMPLGSYAKAEAALLQLGAEAARPLIVSLFFNELTLSGRAANTQPGAGFARGYAAIDALFPGSRAVTAASPYAGNLTLPFSRVYTLAGGHISLLAPGGLVDVGLANPPPDLGLQRGAAELGIVAQGAGSVSIYARGDVLVNQSRVFTLQGGNILVWSNEGNIDAGRGAKSAVSAPPPSVVVDKNGNVSLNFVGAVAGSGIRTIQTNPAFAPGNVDLIAPTGFVNAGDAGIGSAGNLNIAAQRVIGLDNIQIGGAASGVPAATNGLGASLAGVSSVAGSSSNAASAAAAPQADTQSKAPLAQNALSWLDVFVTGLGEENCKPDDLDCLKRQKHP